MYLKGLEMQGFKSFADKITLDFSSGVTAIVGPNGSGKSNISDAVRWVLGEQSAKTLRGSNMQDVIFNGTQKRNPLGFAEVTLILENKNKIFPIEFDEVAVTRKVFASGESQYMINKTPCRLKDIHELFMDTGLGRDGYSMIGQGKIEEILSTKSEDRRQIFEEAAGISKYRYRKEEAERKLTKTEENISRVADIIVELENQLEPLLKQSEKAKKYLVLKEDLKVYEVNAALSVISENKVQMSELEEKYRIVSGHLEAAKHDMEKAELEQEEFYQTAREKEESVRQNEQELRNTETQISMDRSDVEVLSNTISGNMQLIERIEGEMRELESRILDVKNDILKAEEEKRAFIEQKAEKEEKIVKLQLDSEELSGGAGQQNEYIESLKDAMVESLNLVSDCKIKLSNEDIIRQGLKSRCQTVDNEIAKKNEDFSQLENKMNELKKELERKEKFIADIEARMHDEQTQKEEFVKSLSDNQKRLTQVNIELNDKRSRLNMLRAMEQNFEGYSKSVKEIMQQHENGALKKASIYGPVSKLISSDAKYTLAIEAALGGKMQNIVVESEEDAKAAIEYLKSAKSGRATFMPISAVKGNELEVDKISHEKGFLGLASDLVSCDRKFEDIVKNLLGRTVVLETMDDAISVSRKYKNEIRIVTLGGELFNVGGSISGGSANRHASLMGREKEIKQLEQDAKRLENEYEQKTKELSDSEKKLESLELAIMKSADMLSENREVLIVIKQDIAHNEKLSSDFADATARLEIEKAEINNKILMSEKESKALSEKIESEEAVIAQKRDEINKLEQEFEAIMIRKQRIADQIVDITVEKSAIEKDIAVLDEKIADLTRDGEQHRNNADLRKSEIDDIKNKNSQFADDIEAKRLNIETMTLKTEEYKQEIANLLGEKSDFEEKSRKMQTR